jgi:DnaJ domain
MDISAAAFQEFLLALQLHRAHRRRSDANCFMVLTLQTDDISTESNAKNSLMQVNRRRAHRKPSQRTYSISWQDEGGVTHSAQLQGTDESELGVGFRCPVELREGTVVHIQAQEGYPASYGIVRHSTRRDSSYIVGLELDQSIQKTRPTLTTNGATNYYEFLQISPKAQAETIQRVYRFLASRYHPDNRETGDPEKFLLLNQAYEVLSDPERRARYDSTLSGNQGPPDTLFESVDFLDGIEGEVNRRLAVLALLYRKCRANVHNPQVSLLELEGQMGVPREYLDFTIWYLKSKKYIKQEDNAALAVTSVGVDYIESNYSNVPLLPKLLNAGTHRARGSAGDASGESADDAVDNWLLS